MNNELAIKLLKDIRGVDALELDALNLAIQTLEKQIPIKVRRNENDNCCCSSCRNEEGLGDYCSECGKLLDWGF